MHLLMSNVSIFNIASYIQKWGLLDSREYVSPQNMFSGAHLTCYTVKQFYTKLYDKFIAQICRF